MIIFAHFFPTMKQTYILAPDRSFDATIISNSITQRNSLLQQHYEVLKLRCNKHVCRPQQAQTSAALSSVVQRKPNMY